MARFSFGVLLVVALASSPALAQAGEKKPEVRYEKRTYIDISEQQIEGRVVGPSGTRVVSRGKPKFRNLIVLRKHFRPQMLDSANDL